MKVLNLFYGKYGQAFFDGDNLIHYIHENDGDYRPEYFNPLLKYFDAKVDYIDKLNEKQTQLLNRYEE